MQPDLGFMDCLAYVCWRCLFIDAWRGSGHDITLKACWTVQLDDVATKRSLSNQILHRHQSLLEERESHDIPLLTDVRKILLLGG